MRALTLLGLIAVVAAGGGCARKAKKTEPVAQTAPTQASETPPTDAGTGVGFTRGGNTNYVAGGGVAQNVRQAGRRTVALNDFKQLGIAIQQVQLLDGMPDKERIKAEVRTFGPIATAINDGSIILTGTKDPAGLWAYEVDADTKGGIVLIGGTARRADAAEVKQLLARK